jgi:hypothetical protein
MSERDGDQHDAERGGDKIGGDQHENSGVTGNRAATTPFPLGATTLSCFRGWWVDAHHKRDVIFANAE